MRGLRISTAMLVLIGACANTCGSNPEPASSAPARVAAVAPMPAPAAADGAFNESRPAWQPARDSELTRRLRAAQAAIETDRKLGGLASTAQLSAALLSRIGKFSAAGEVASTEQRDGAAPLVAVARNYQQGAATARVKITDTSQLPSARHALSSHLALIGNEAAGNEHGAFVRGRPALFSHGDGYSRATALVGGFLVQINVQGSPDPNAAQSLLERLDWSSFAVEPADGPDATQ